MLDAGKREKTIAAVLDRPDAGFALGEIMLDSLRPDEIRVKIEACGVCHTDAVCRHFIPTPSVLGHEGVGIIEEVGANVRDLEPGQRVVLCYPFCGGCEACLKDEPFFCTHNAALSFSGRRLDGSPTAWRNGEALSAAFFQQSSFAHHAIAPARSAVLAPEDLDPAILAALPCGVSTGVGSMINAFALKPADRILIFGAGAVGLSAVLGAKIAGAAEIVICDLNQHRLALAAEFGATQTIRADDPDASEMLKSIAPTGFGYVFDTSSAHNAWTMAMENLASGGLFGFVAVPQPMDEYSFRPIELMYRAGRMQAVIQGSSVSRTLLPKLLQWRREGRLPVDRMIETFKFKSINEAFEASVRGQVVKPVLLMD